LEHYVYSTFIGPTAHKTTYGHKGQMLGNNPKERKQQDITRYQAEKNELASTGKGNYCWKMQGIGDFSLMNLYKVQTMLE
jgi:hypothetical protein